ncbi:hypothetical protein ACLB2K_025979 [Fragaria x ananassa]
MTMMVYLISWPSPLDFVWIWVSIQNLPPRLMTGPTMRLVGETIGPIMQVDLAALRCGEARVLLSLPLHNPVRLKQRLWVSLLDVITVTYKYERLLGSCRVCMRIDHGGLPCPHGSFGYGDPVHSLDLDNTSYGISSELTSNHHLSISS